MTIGRIRGRKICYEEQNEKLNSSSSMAKSQQCHLDIEKNIKGAVKIVEGNFFIRSLGDL